MATTETRQRHRFRWLIPLGIALVWMFFAGVAGGYSERLGEVVKNDNAAFLPTNAEATEVARQEPGFYGAEQSPAVILYVRATGVTDADRATVAADMAFFPSVEGVAGAPLGPLPSADGQALQVIVPVSITGDATILPQAIDDLRERAESHGDLTAYVTGPAGLSGDAEGIFSGTDTRLLLIALVIVFIILVLVYRSLIMPIIVLTTAQLAQVLASAAVYLLADRDLIDLNGQSQGALVLICIGTATDYALLLCGRYREELAVQPTKYDAMWAALRNTVPTILASGLIVIAAMSCLLLSELGSNRGYGPVFALGITASLLAAFTILPALLLIFGRIAFWPAKATVSGDRTAQHRIWARISELVSRRARAIWMVTTVVLIALAAFLPTLAAKSVPFSEYFLDKPPSLTGAEELAEHYPAGSGSPALIITPQTDATAVTQAVEAVDGVAAVEPFTSGTPGIGAPPKVVDGKVLLEVTLADPADSTRAEQTVERIRDAVHDTTGDSAVGGTTAIAIDTAAAGWADLRLVIPLVLAVVFLLLMVLLRSFLGPFVLILTVILSVAATVGLSSLIFNALDHPGVDVSLPLFCAVFLIAVGVDYNIFLMARVREETKRLADTRTAVTHALTVTGGVITSAGVVLGATFSLFMVVPYLPFVQIGTIIVLGILIDTLVVRALLVPALAYDLDRRFWWPSKLSRRTTTPAEQPQSDPVPTT
jgi:RND superfamily putative drug exporter